MDLRSQYEEIIRDNLELDILSQDRRFDILQMVELMIQQEKQTKM